MKDNLRENMKRFATKNLHEQNFKDINKVAIKRRFDDAYQKGMRIDIKLRDGQATIILHSGEVGSDPKIVQIPAKDLAFVLSSIKS